MNLLLSLSLLASAPSGLSLNISTPRASVLVGEPLKLVVTWKAVGSSAKGVKVEREDFTSQSLLFVIDDGTGARKYMEYPRSLAERVTRPTDLKAGEDVVTNLVLLRGGYVTGLQDRPVDGLLLPAKGRYSLQAVYVGQEPWVGSNALAVTVTEPKAVDREIFVATSHDRRALEADGDARAQAMARDLVQKHPDSPYLRWAHLSLLKNRGEALHNWYDPDTGQPLLDHGEETVKQVRKKHYREMTDDILGALDWGPFEEEALTLAFQYAQASGHSEGAQRARKGLFEKYPRSAVVKQIKANETPD